MVSEYAKVPIAAIRRKFIRLNPDRILERRKADTQQVTTMGSLLCVNKRREKKMASEIKVTVPPIINGDVGTKKQILDPTNSHNTNGRIRC